MKMTSKIEFKYTDLDGSEYTSSFEGKGGLVIGDVLAQFRAFLITAGYTWVEYYDIDIRKKEKENDSVHE